MSEESIQKFALIEGKTILATHCATVFKWASMQETVLTEATQEALKATLARMYQVLEGMPMVKSEKRTH